MPRLAALGALVLGVALGVAPASPAATSTAITSAGPLTNIAISTELNCAVNHTGDSSGEFFEDTACATELATGGLLFGPSDIPAGNNPGGFDPVSQSGVTGSGTAADPYTIVTVVDAVGVDLRLTETDTYVVGQETYTTTVAIANSGAQARDVVLYRGGDCFLQNADEGFGAVGNPDGAVACVAAANPSDPSPVPGTRIEQWVPLTAGSHYLESTYSALWSAMNTGDPFPDTCDCPVFEDNGAGLSWSLTVPAGGTSTVSHLTVFSPQGGLVLSTKKTADQATVGAGQGDGYTITVSNPNKSAVPLATISDALPAGFSYVAGSTTGATTANPTISGQTLTWSGPFAVPAGDGSTPGSTSLHFNVTVAATPGDYVNNAGATATGFTVVPTGDTAPVTVVPAADLSIAKTDSPDPVTVGNDLTYSLLVTNHGPQDAAGVTVTDALPAGATLVSSSTTTGSCSGTATVACTIGTLANGASATVTIVVTPGSVGQLSNTATVSATTDDPVAANDSSTTTTTVSPLEADVSVAKSDSPDPVSVGSPLTWTLAVANHGPDAAAGVTVTDVLPSGVTFVSSSTTVGSCSGTATVTCNLGTLANGAGATVKIVVTPGSAGTLSNTARVSATTDDPVAGNNSSSVSTTVNDVTPPTPEADVSVAKSDSPDPVSVGSPLTWTLAVANHGPDAAAGVTVTDVLPSGVTFVSSSTTVGSCSGTATVTCNLGTLANGAGATVKIVVTPGSAGTLSNTARVSATTDDPVAGNNSSSVSTTVNDVTPPTPEADVSVAKSDSPDPVSVGSPLTWTLAVANHGPDAAAGVTVTDVLPSGVTFVSSSTTVGSCSGTATVTCNLGTLANGAGATVKIVVTPGSAGTLSNTARVSATTDDPVAGNNSSSVSTTVNNVTLVVTTTALPDAALGSAYSATLAAAGGVTPYSWSLQSGALPSGLSLGSGGVISGTPLVPGTSSFTVQVSDAEAPAMSATASLSITVGGCTTTVSGGGSGPLQIGPGVTCVIGASVPGPVSISPGAVVVLVGATIAGPLTAGGAAQVVVCDSTIMGRVTVTGTSGAVLIGSTDGGSPACGGNLIMGPVTLSGNSGSVTVADNTILGPAALTGNGGPAALVAANTVAGPLSCSANSASPTNNGKPNSVQGPASGQCAALD